MAGSIPHAAVPDPQQVAARLAFIDLASQELRTPLTIATGMLHVARRPGPVPVAAVDHLLDRGEAALLRLERLVDHLTFVTRLATGMHPVQRETVSLRDVLDGVVAGSTDPEGVVLGGATDQEVAVDAEVLRRLAAALVENALTYAGHAEVVAHPGAVEVCDRGPGLPADVLAHLHHDALAPGDRGTTEGLGVGLSLVRVLAGELGAQLHVRSAPGEGTAVRVALPR